MDGIFVVTVVVVVVVVVVTAAANEDDGALNAVIVLFCSLMKHSHTENCNDWRKQAGKLTQTDRLTDRPRPRQIDRPTQTQTGNDKGRHRCGQVRDRQKDTELRKTEQADRHRHRQTGTDRHTQIDRNGHRNRQTLRDKIQTHKRLKRTVLNHDKKHHTNFLPSSGHHNKMTKQLNQKQASILHHIFRRLTFV